MQVQNLIGRSHHDTNSNIDSHNCRSDEQLRLHEIHPANHRPAYTSMTSTHPFSKLLNSWATLLENVTPPPTTPFTLAQQYLWVLELFVIVVLALGLGLVINRVVDKLEVQAAKTRGKSTWAGTNSFGKLGRLGLAVLKYLQYHR